MNVSPLQYNNSQSFGMAFKLKKDGAKKLAAFLDGLDPKEASRIQEDLIKPIHAAKTEVVFDGTDIIIKNVSRNLVSGSKKDSKSKTLDLKISHLKPIISYNPGYSVRYFVENKKYPNGISISHDTPHSINLSKESNPLVQKLFNTREIVKYLEAEVQNKTYNSAKKARIKSKAKELKGLYG